jgi:methylaspartate ammonia-lyase
MRELTKEIDRRGITRNSWRDEWCNTLKISNISSDNRAGI